MGKQESKKKKSKLGKVFSIIVDILVVPVIVIAFACTILTFSAKANNKVPQIFGKSIVTVLTPSMEPDFMVGDVLIINKVDVNTLKVGDNIAFYAPIWLGSPYTTTLDNGEKVSNIIYHQIVTIINAPNEDGVRERYFVCRGTNLSDPEYVYVGENKGYYTKDGDNYVMTPDGSKTGDYDVKLENMPADTEGDINPGDIEDSSMSTMQYVSDDLVVGIYDSSLSPAIGGFIKFCSSSTGLLCLVVVPAALMLVFVALNMVKEVKASKEETEQDQLALEGNIEKLKETSIKAKQEVKEEKPDTNKKTKKTENVDINAVISGAVADANDGVEIEKPQEQKAVKAKVATPKKEIVSTDKGVTESPKTTTPKTANPAVPKTVSANAEAQKVAQKTVTKTAPKVAPKPAVKPATEASKPASKPVTPKVAPKPVAKPVADTAPKTATAVKKPASKPVAPKVTEEKPAVKTAPKAAPKAAPKPAVKPTVKKDN